jgi:hypothetical protein
MHTLSTLTSFVLDSPLGGVTGLKALTLLGMGMPAADGLVFIRSVYSV